MPMRVGSRAANAQSDRANKSSSRASRRKAACFRMFAKAGFVLNHVSPTEVRPYSNDEMIAWLRDLYRQLRAIYDETAPRS